jgi:hypothetical protein
MRGSRPTTLTPTMSGMYLQHRQRHQQSRQQCTTRKTVAASNIRTRARRTGYRPVTCCSDSCIAQQTDYNCKAAVTLALYMRYRAVRVQSNSQWKVLHEAPHIWEDIVHLEPAARPLVAACYAYTLVSVQLAVGLRHHLRV